MTKIDIVSGFLGAGKTTLIKKLLKEALADSKVVLIENEFGEIGIDGGFLKEAGIEIKEMNSGCICCSLVGDFGASLKEVLDTYTPERILIEPSGVGKLSDVMKAVQDAMADREVELNSAVAVVDACKCKMYIKNFGEFFINQIEHAGTVILSRTDKLSEEKLSACVEMIREHNAKATVITTPWDALTGNDILETIEGAKDLEAELMKEVMRIMRSMTTTMDRIVPVGVMTMSTDIIMKSTIMSTGTTMKSTIMSTDTVMKSTIMNTGTAMKSIVMDTVMKSMDMIIVMKNMSTTITMGSTPMIITIIMQMRFFTSWGMETPAVYSKEEIAHILEELDKEEVYGMVLRAKGMVSSSEGGWIYFDYVPEESNIRSGKPDVTGKFCVIGSGLKEDKLAELFHR